MKFILIICLLVFLGPALIQLLFAAIGLGFLIF